VLDLAVESPAYNVRGIPPVPYIDVAATMNGKTVSMFILNRDLENAREVEIIWRESPPQKVLFSQVLTGPDLKASNSFEAPKKVAPGPFEASGNKLKVPARSYTVIQWGS
jgi:alpha-N-arabinofuranosidase